MDTSHNLIATKTCPSYELLVVIGQVRVRMVCEADAG